MSISAAEAERIAATGLTFGRDRFTVKLTDGRHLIVPLDWYPRLQLASSRERANWRLAGAGAGLHWPDIEEDISVASLLAGRRSMESEKSFTKWLADRKKKVRKSA